MRPLQHVHLVVECEGKLKRLEVLDLSFRFNWDAFRWCALCPPGRDEESGHGGQRLAELS